MISCSNYLIKTFKYKLYHFIEISRYIQCYLLIFEIDLILYKIGIIWNVQKCQKLIETDTVGSPFLSEVSSVPYRTQRTVHYPAYRTLPSVPYLTVLNPPATDRLSL